WRRKSPGLAWGRLHRLHAGTRLRRERLPRGRVIEVGRRIERRRLGVGVRANEEHPERGEAADREGSPRSRASRGLVLGSALVDAAGGLAVHRGPFYHCGAPQMTHFWPL